MFTLEEFVLNRKTAIGADGVSRVENMEIKATDIGDKSHFDPGLMRPYRDDRGNVWVDVTIGHEVAKDRDGAVIMNARGEPKYKPIYDTQLVRDRINRDLPVLNVDNASVLRKDQWLTIDASVQEASRKRMRAWADLRASNTMSGFDGMATPILEWERLTDAGEAVVDMFGEATGNDFAPQYDLQGMPLPMTYVDFALSKRFLAVSRAKGQAGADTVRARMAGRRIGETLERTYIGTQTGLVYGKSTDYAQTSAVYGLTNHPERITVTGATAPTGSNGTTILTEWLAQREQFFTNNFYGPFMVYTATSYDQYLDNLFSTSEPSAGKLRQQLLAIDGITGIRRLDYLTTSGTAIWVDMSGDNITAVNGMDITTVQWSERGGMDLRFRVMTIQAPLIKSTYINSGTSGPASSTTLKTPIVHVTI